MNTNSTRMTRHAARISGPIAAFVATLALAAVQPRAAAAAAPVVANASVEQADAGNPTKPAGWSSNAWGTLQATFTWLQGDCAAGNRCLRVDGTKPAGSTLDDGDAKWWSDPIAVTGGSRLTASLKMRSTVTTWLMAFATGTSNGQAKEQWIMLQQAPVAATWSPLQATLDVPSWASAVRLMVVLPSSGRVDCDDWALTEQAVAPKHPAKVSITFDDGWVTAYAWLVPELDKRQIRATHFVISGYIDKPGYTADYIGTARVRELLGKGHEVASHTINHQDMTKVSGAELNDNLEQSKVALTNFGTTIAGFAWPYGSYNAEIAKRAKETYSYVRTVDPGLNLLPYDLSKLKGYVVTNTTTVDEIESWVQQAETIDGAWLILIYHRADPDAPLDSYVTPQSFVDTLDMLQAHNADIRPVGTWLDAWKAQPLPDLPVWEVDGGESFDAPGKLELAPSAGGSPDLGCSAAPAAPSSNEAWPPLGLLGLLASLGLVLRRRNTSAR